MTVQIVQPNKHRTRDEIYVSIVERIKQQYGGKITEAEAHDAARNLLGFCQRLMDFHREREK